MKLEALQARISETKAAREEALAGKGPFPKQTAYGLGKRLESLEAKLAAMAATMAPLPPPVKLPAATKGKTAAPAPSKRVRVRISLRRRSRNGKPLSK